jgi:hypothetical protein
MLQPSAERLCLSDRLFLIALRLSLSAISDMQVAGKASLTALDGGKPRLIPVDDQIRSH